MITKMKTALAGAILSLALLGGAATAAPIVATGDAVRGVTAAADASSTTTQVHWRRHHRHWHHRHHHRYHHHHRSHRHCRWVRRCAYYGCRIVRRCHRHW